MVGFRFECMEDLIEAVPSHPPTAECDDQECLVCGIRDCPHSEPLHYHHDGCPACWEPSYAVQEARYELGGEG